MHLRINSTAGGAAVGLAILIAAASGCSTVRDAREAQKGSGIPPGERTVTAAETGLSSNSVLSLDEAVRIALAYHPAVTQARQSLASAASGVEQARASLRPQVSASGSYSRRTSNSDASAESNSNDPSYSASLGLDILVYDFGKTPAAVKQAWARQAAADENLRQVRNDTAYAVRTAFYNLSKAEELLKVANHAVLQYAAHRDLTKASAEVGLRTRYDVTKAEVDLGNAKLSLIDAAGAVRTARASLNRSLGLAEDPGYTIGTTRTNDIAGTVETLMDVARKSHPALRSLRAEERIASAAVDQAIADLYPSISLSGSYLFGGTSFPLVWNWSAALQAGMSLFTGSRKSAAIDAAVASLRSARAQLADREQQIYLDLSRALSVRETARYRMELTGLLLKQATESLELVNERYRQGKASSVEVTDAQVALTQAMADEVKARFDLQTAVAQIRHTTGDEKL